MDAVRSRLDASYDETITLAALAREFHISSFHLAHAFKAPTAMRRSSTSRAAASVKHRPY